MSDLTTAHSSMHEGDQKHLQWLNESTRDAKKAPEIAAWLFDGPLTIGQIIHRRLSKHGSGDDDPIRSVNEMYAHASVMHDLGRIANMGGAVEYRQGKLHLREEYRGAVLEWVRQEAIRIAEYRAERREAFAE